MRVCCKCNHIDKWLSDKDGWICDACKDSQSETINWTCPECNEVYQVGSELNMHLCDKCVEKWRSKDNPVPSYVKEVVSHHIKCLELEQAEVEKMISSLEKQLREKNGLRHELQGKRNELEIFLHMSR